MDDAGAVTSRCIIFLPGERRPAPHDSWQGARVRGERFRWRAASIGPAGKLGGLIQQPLQQIDKGDPVRGKCRGSKSRQLRRKRHPSVEGRAGTREGGRCRQCRGGFCCVLPCQAVRRTVTECSGRFRRGGAIRCRRPATASGGSGRAGQIPGVREGRGKTRADLDHGQRRSKKHGIEPWRKT